MGDSSFRIRPGLRQEWIRYRHKSLHPDEGWLRAGVAGAYLPPMRLAVPHETQAAVADSIPRCAAMVLRAYGLTMDAERLGWLMETDDLRGPAPRSLARLGAWGIKAEFPSDLQFFRDGTIDLNRRLATSDAQLVFRWEERWLRYVRAALREGVPPILFVDLGRLSPRWRGLRQPHAVVLSGGDGRQAWINDPARADGPVRIGLATLMNALLPGEPLAALLRVERIDPEAGLKRDAN